MTETRRWRGCVFIGVSLDGFIAKPDGDLAWLTDPSPRDHAVGSADRPALAWDTFFPGVDALVMGRSTYETVAAFEEWPFDGLRVIVLSTTLVEVDERIAIARSVDEAATMLEANGSTRAYVDGGRTIQSFLAAGLVDELTVSFAPILLGGGSRLFGDLDEEVLLTLRGHHATADDGMVRATYEVAPRPSIMRS